MKKPGPEWARMRANQLALYYECYACFTDDDLVVHHIRYRGKRGASEKPGDLATLCGDCHRELHRVVGPGSRFVEGAVEKTYAWLRARRDEWFARNLDGG